jgi:hypothetical protein
MNDHDRLIRTGFGVLTESAPSPATYEEITAQSGPARSRTPFYAVAVACLALLVFVATVVLDGGTRLAYAMEPGLDLTYTVNSETTLDGETFSSGPATVNYQISEAGDGLLDVQISYAPLEGCGHECMPGVTFSQTVTGDGEIVAINVGEGVEFPEFVIPVPIPQGGITAGFPLYLGPPLPADAVAPGDTWETLEGGVAGQHELGGETQLDGRDVVTIDSKYTYTHPDPELGEYTASTTVWLDPAAGVVVQAQITRITIETGKAVEMEFHLDG